MAKTGNPNNRDIPHWSPYTLPTRDTMIIDGNPRMENNPRRLEAPDLAKNYRFTCQPGDVISFSPGGGEGGPKGRMRGRPAGFDAIGGTPPHPIRLR